MSLHLSPLSRCVAVVALSSLLIADLAATPVSAGQPAEQGVPAAVDADQTVGELGAASPGIVIGDEVERTAASASSVARFRADFEVDPARPRNFSATRFAKQWHVTQTVTDYQRWENGDPVEGEHGADCGAPPATHLANQWNEYVYLCRGHLMTARAAPSYGATYLMPLARLDWSTRRATARWDMSTFSMSSRDWVDVWVTPMRNALAVPIEHDGVAFQGTPRNAIHVRGANGAESWTLEVIRDFRTVGESTLSIPDSFPRSAATRTPMKLVVRKGEVTFTMKGVGTTRVGVGPNFERALVQWGHHAYNPTKDNAGEAATWHWDTFTLAPASVLPAKRVSPNRVIADPGERRTLRFASPATRKDFLMFDAVCRVELNFGSGFQPVAKQAASEGNSTPESQSSYLVPVPEGKTKVVVRFRGDGWYDGWPCTVENPIILKNLANPRPVPTASAAPRALRNSLNCWIPRR